MQPIEAEIPLAHSYVDLDDVRLHVVEAGQGPLVILLHGFPEFWYSWRHQIPALARAGYHVFAPDMRGYNRSDKPHGVRPYRIDMLIRDVARLIDHAGVERAVVVGHDWGGVVAWQFAMRYPERVRRLVILNAPHPARVIAAGWSWKQLRRSWYVFFFQLPWLPEASLRARRFALLRRVLRTGPMCPGSFGPSDIERYVAAAAQPGALTAAINYYRALLRQSPAHRLRRLRPIAAQTLVIWGERDRYLGPELAEPVGSWVPDLRVERLADAGHWVQNDRPERVNRLLLDFLRGA